MRKLIALLFLATSVYAVPPTITPSLPIVWVSSAMQFTSNQSVTWSMMQGSTGTISAGGLYTAPGPIRAKQSIYGCVVSPQDLITLTNISSLPVDTSSTNYMRAQAGGAAIALEPDMPVNIYSNATSSQTLAFRYTPSNDGDYKVGDVYDLRMENGIFADKDVDKDTHILAIDKDSCIASEQYKLYPIGTEAACLTCNSQSGVAFQNQYNFVQGTTAGGLPIITHIITYRDMRDCVDRGIPISHALRMSFSVGILANSHKWPAVAHATDGGQLPFGTYVRLVSTYSVTGSAAAQCIQQALKDYGAVLDDGGINGHIQIEQAAIGDYDLFSVMNELAGISEFKVANLEAVDVSSLQDVDTNSPTYGYGRVTSTNPYVVPSNFAVVIASNTTTHESSFMPIIVQPITIGTEREVGYTFMPGTPQTQLPVWVHGAVDTTFSCSMSPTLGSLTAGGLYTAPSNSFTRSSTTVTCTATADTKNATVSFGVTVTSGTVRTRLANATNTDYTAADGNKWYIDYGNLWRLQGRSNCDWRGESWGITDEDLYQECQYVNDGSGDMLHHMYVPNGTYQVDLYFAVGDAFSTDNWVFAIDSQDTIYSGSSATTIAGNGAWTFFGLTGQKVDLCDIIGACTSDTVGTVTLNVTVSDNNLNFWIRHLTINGSSSRPSLLNAFRITQTSSGGGGGGGGGSGISGNGVIWRR